MSDLLYDIKDRHRIYTATKYFNNQNIVFSVTNNIKNVEEFNERF